MDWWFTKISVHWMKHLKIHMIHTLNNVPKVLLLYWRTTFCCVCLCMMNCLMLLQLFSFWKTEVQYLNVLSLAVYPPSPRRPALVDQGLDAERITLWASRYQCSSKARVTSVKFASSLICCNSLSSLKLVSFLDLVKHFYHTLVWIIKLSFVVSS